jgi:hypothetical protein
LKAAKELPELGILGHYFGLHICINNADSGHSAMAEATIRMYIDHMRRAGAMEVQQAWKSNLYDAAVKHPTFPSQREQPLAQVE